MAGINKAKGKVVDKTENLFPKRVPITKLNVKKIDPKNNTLFTDDNQSYTYD